MLILSNEEIEAIISYDEMMRAIEDAYGIYEKNAYHMPNRFHVDYQQKNVLYMPCFLDGVFGTKILTIFPENIQKGIPSLDGLMLLNDLDTGAPLCMMDGKTITALRTGAAGGTAIRYTTPETVESVGLIGAGVQGLYQLIYAFHVRPFKRAYIHDAFKKNFAEFEQKLLCAVPQAEIIICDNVRSLVTASDVIITATTATEPPIPNDAALLKGKHFIGIGSYKPHMREMPDALFSLLDSVYIDADIALEESGDLIQPMEHGLLQPEQIKRFGQLIHNPAEIHSLQSKTSFFKTVGIAIFDMVAARLLYQKAKEQNVGYEL